MQIFLTHCNEWYSQEKLLPLIAWLPLFIQQDILAYRRSEDATRAYLGKCLVRYGFEQLGIPFSWHNVKISEKDRPFLPEAEMDFNISHSGEYVVAAIGSGKVGVDVERHRKVHLDVFDRQFNAKEWEVILSAKDPSKQFFDYWAIKEAAIKADGRGVAVLSKTAILSDNLVMVEDMPLHYHPLQIAEGYSAAVVALNDSDMDAFRLCQVDSSRFFD
jgi:4'-phosphopantetheinyl transferase